MSIDSASGLIQWTPTTEQTGTHSIAVRVQDQGGLFDIQNFTIVVPTPLVNHPPTITSVPVSTCPVTQTPEAVSSITIDATIRDFLDSHPDFEKGISGVVKGLVQNTLGPDKNPIFAGANGAGAISSASSFSQWYADVPGINTSTSLPLTLTETSPASGIYSFVSNSFFPIDGQLFGNQGRSHNYHFALELHARFTYRGGEIFNFTGDDDVWVFINNTLAVDLGGVHGPSDGSVNLDSLNLIPGKTYPFDFFFAERHTVGSNFLLQTSIAFTTL